MHRLSTVSTISTIALLLTVGATAGEGTAANNVSAFATPLNDSTISISGISAGAAMAVQYATAFSRSVKAAGIIAGLPYMCALQSLPALETALAR